MNHSTEKRNYLPAAGRDWLLTLYDPLTRLFGLQAHYYRLLAHVDLCPTHQVLDIGCGTGTLAKIIKEHSPSIRFVGIDPDPRALTIARSKLKPFENVQLDTGFADALPYAKETYDFVLSSFVFHHLEPLERISMCEEARRVLKANGSFNIIDFDRIRRTSVIDEPSVLDCLRVAGFKTIETHTEHHWPFGAISFHSATTTYYNS